MKERYNVLKHIYQNYLILIIKNNKYYNFDEDKLIYTYINRNLNTNNQNAKSIVIEKIIEKTGQSLTHTTMPKIFHNKFDIFRWRPKKNE